MAVSYQVSPQALSQILKLLGYKSAGGMKKASRSGVTTPVICMNAGVPTDDNANFDPFMVGSLCLDYTNNDVYVCSAYTSSTTFTWTKIAT